MINCPKCQVPNPDNATVCMACGANLAEHQFAQALDEAQQADPAQAAAQQAAQPDAQPAAQPAQAPAQPQFQLPPEIEQQQQQQFAGQPMDPGQAQAEINQFMAQERARKNKKRIIYFIIFAAIAGVVAFFWIQSAARKAREQAVVKFFTEFRKIDDGAVSDFWKCAVRAKIRDVRLAADSAEITDGLQKAFSNFPTSQPSRLLDKCIPMIPGVLQDLEKLEVPEGFEEPVNKYKAAMKEIQQVFTAYAKLIDKRKDEAADEQEIRNAHADFHKVMYGGGGGMASVADTPKAVAYFNILKCAVPDLVKNVRKVTKPPDSQYVVEYIYNTCKDDKGKFADVLRKECFAKRNQESMRTNEFKMVADKMSGDDRDLYAINDCFKRANHGFAFEELKAIAEVFGTYRNKARGDILKAIERVKQEINE